MSKLTRGELVEKSDIIRHDWTNKDLNELERLGVILPDPPEPKKKEVKPLMDIIKGWENLAYEDELTNELIENGYLAPSKTKKTIEIDREVWVNVYPDHTVMYSSKDTADAMATEKRISCEKFELKRTVEVE